MVGTSAEDFARGRASALNAFSSETVVIQRVLMMTLVRALFGGAASFELLSQAGGPVI